MGNRQYIKLCSDSFEFFVTHSDWWPQISDVAKLLDSYSTYWMLIGVKVVKEDDVAEPEGLFQRHQEPSTVGQLDLLPAACSSRTCRARDSSSGVSPRFCRIEVELFAAM